jgi:hypothetical protein
MPTPRADDGPILLLRSALLKLVILDSLLDSSFHVTRKVPAALPLAFNGLAHTAAPWSLIFRHRTPQVRIRR